MRVTLCLCLCVCVPVLKNTITLQNWKISPHKQHPCTYKYFVLSRYRRSPYINEVTFQRIPSIFRSSVSQGMLDFTAALKVLDASLIWCYEGTKSQVSVLITKALIYYNSSPYLLFKHLLWIRHVKWCSKHHMWCWIDPVGPFVMCAEYTLSFSS